MHYATVPLALAALLLGTPATPQPVRSIRIAQGGSEQLPSRPILSPWKLPMLHRALSYLFGYSLTTQPYAHSPTPSSGILSGPFDLGGSNADPGYKLTLPVDSSAALSGNAHEIFPWTWGQWMVGDENLVTYRGTYFKRTLERYEFYSPKAGATTASASNARCELRHLRNYGPGEAMSQQFVFCAEGAVEGVKIIIGQIHRLDADPVFKLVYTSNTSGAGIYRALVKKTDGASDTEKLLLGSITDGDLIACKYAWIPGGHLQFWCLKWNGGNPRSPVFPATPTQTFTNVMSSGKDSYKKLGAYVNNHNPPTGQQTDIQSVFVYHDLQLD